MASASSTVECSKCGRKCHPQGRAAHERACTGTPATFGQNGNGHHQEPATPPAPVENSEQPVQVQFCPCCGCNIAAVNEALAKVS